MVDKVQRIRGDFCKQIEEKNAEMNKLVMNSNMQYNYTRHMVLKSLPTCSKCSLKGQAKVLTSYR